MSMFTRIHCKILLSNWHATQVVENPIGLSYTRDWSTNHAEVLSRIWLELAISVVRHADATASRSEVNRHRFEWLG